MSSRSPTTRWPRGISSAAGTGATTGTSSPLAPRQQHCRVHVFSRDLSFVSMLNIPPKNENADIVYLRFSNDTSLLPLMDSNLYVCSISGAASDIWCLYLFGFGPTHHCTGKMPGLWETAHWTMTQRKTTSRLVPAWLARHGLE